MDGIQRMIEASGLSKPTILKGIREPKGKEELYGEDGRVRSSEEDGSPSKPMIWRSSGYWRR
jgi:hypothetical protein